MKNIGMSKTLTRTYSFRKPIRPIVDIEEEDDEHRRDHSGRKRVDVIQCLLDSSSDELEDENFIMNKLNSILWLTLDEIRHIRFVVTQTSEKQLPSIRWGYSCFRCRKRINYFYFLPSFLRSINHECCFVCQQIVCRKCSFINFLPPSPRLLIPVRIQTLIKPSTMMIEKKYEKSNQTMKTICYDCLQIFNEIIKVPRDPIVPLRRTFSLPPMSSQNSNDNRHTRHRRRSPMIKPHEECP